MDDIINQRKPVEMADFLSVEGNGGGVDGIAGMGDEAEGVVADDDCGVLTGCEEGDDCIDEPDEVEIGVCVGLVDCENEDGVDDCVGLTGCEEGI
jgi:hypothetical protein